MDAFLRAIERQFYHENSNYNWQRLLRASRLAGHPRFTQEGLETALGGAEKMDFDRTPTGFRAKVKTVVYPYRHVVVDLAGSYEEDSDLESRLDTTNWNGWIEVAWRPDDDEPELRIAVAESWQFPPEYHAGGLNTRDYRYYGGPVTNDEELSAALFDFAHWETI